MLRLQCSVCRGEPQIVLSSNGRIIFGHLTPIREAQMLLPPQPPPPLITSTSFCSFAQLFLCAVQCDHSFRLHFFNRDIGERTTMRWLKIKKKKHPKQKADHQLANNNLSRRGALLTAAKKNIQWCFAVLLTHRKRPEASEESASGALRR